MRVLIASLVLAAGCFDPVYPKDLACPEGACPPGEHCWSDGTCHGGVEVERNRVFVASTPLTIASLNPLFPQAAPDLEVLAAADEVCETAASAAGLPEGRYVAWLSTRTVNAVSRLAGDRGWVRVDGRPFADTVEAMMGSITFYPPRLDEAGNEMSGVSLLTASTTAGELGDNCADLTSTSATETMNIGLPEGGAVYWAGGTTMSCSVEPFHLLCFGLGRPSEVLAPTPVVGRHAFLSRATRVGSIGLDGADSLCQSEAEAGGYPGTYKAMLGTSSATAASRFVDGEPWVRCDGIPLTPTAAGLLQGEGLDVAVDCDSLGTRFVTAWTWTGATSVAVTGGESCADWTTASSASTGIRASGLMSGLNWFGGNWGYPPRLVACNTPLRVFCFQE